MLHIVRGPGVRTHNLRAGPNNKTFYKQIYIHTFAQISTPHCTIISLTSCLAIILPASHGRSTRPASPKVALHFPHPFECTMDEVIEVIEELQNLLKGAKNTAGQQTAVEGKTMQ